MAKIFLVSAGHTNQPGQDRGAAGSGFIEGVETVRLRDAVALRLRAAGFTVLEDGVDGVNEPLTKALALVRKADTAIELHFNAGTRTATGVEVLAKWSRKRLAQQIAQAIKAATGLKLRGDAGYKSDTSGQHHRLAFCEKGGLIVEVAFISNAWDMDRYKRNFDAVAQGIADVLAAA